jgi:hypothetical protein
MASGAQLQFASPDEEIALRFKATGDHECFAQLFARYRKKVFFVCRGFFNDGNAAEDATQETFLRAYQNIDRFHGGDFSRWLMRIAKSRFQWSSASWSYGGSHTKLSGLHRGHILPGPAQPCNLIPGKFWKCGLHPRRFSHAWLEKPNRISLFMNFEAVRVKFLLDSRSC